LENPAKSITTTLSILTFRSFYTVSCDSEAPPISKALFMLVIPWPGISTLESLGMDTSKNRFLHGCSE